MAAEMEASRVLAEKLRAKFPEAILETVCCKDEVTHQVEKSAVAEVCEFLKHDSDFQMNYLVDVIGVDHYPDPPRFGVVYHLYSIPKRQRIRLKVRVEDGASVATVTGIWPAADWPEREAYDMFGIVFDGHPNLKRIYMAPDWEGYPLRKDYPLRGYKDPYNPYGEETEEVL